MSISVTVSQLTDKIRDLLEGSALMANLTVEGEVSQFTRYAGSGHCYFSIKDAHAVLKCVMWRSAADRQSFLPKQGDLVEVTGRITVYAARGEYQLQAERITPVGEGDLYARFERLKAQLAEEGLFDSERKRPIPAWPLRIGVVSSPSTAAFQDILNVLGRRYPLAQVVLSPTPVQGTDAPPQIVRALERLNAYGQVDVILIIRGGGSIEDLWCFNDERVVRAVAASAIPIVTGVGHEIDFTLVDFAADLRAPTPSAAAEQSTPHIDGIREALRLLDQQGLTSIRGLIDVERAALVDSARTLAYHSPEVFIRGARQQVDSLSGRMDATRAAHQAFERERLRAVSAALEAANPEAILRRGYAIVTRPDGSRMRASDAHIDDALRIQLADGTLSARVDGVEPQPPTV
jgi:exodeoxyribonuclease VII large subunit